MSSLKTLLYKGNCKPASPKANISIGFVSMFLWTLTAIVASANAAISGNVSGVSVTFKVQDILIMLVSTFLMTAGLAHKSHHFIYPWILLTGWNLYSCQYPNFMKMLYTINRAKIVTKLAYVTFGLYILGLAMKIILILRLLQLAFILWYQREMRKEVN